LPFLFYFSLAFSFLAIYLVLSAPQLNLFIVCPSPFPLFHSSQGPLVFSKPTETYSDAQEVCFTIFKFAATEAETEVVVGVRRFFAETEVVVGVRRFFAETEVVVGVRRFFAIPIISP
jgi:hypothetical protein